MMNLTVRNVMIRVRSDSRIKNLGENCEKFERINMDALSSDVLQYSFGPFLVPSERLKLARLSKFFHRIFYSNYHFDDDFDTKYWTKHFHEFWKHEKDAVRNPKTGYVYTKYISSLQGEYDVYKQDKSNFVEIGSFGIVGSKYDYAVISTWLKIDSTRKQQLKYFLIFQRETLQTYIPSMYIRKIRFENLGPTFHNQELRQYLRSKEEQEQKEKQKNIKNNKNNTNTNNEKKCDEKENEAKKEEMKQKELKQDKNILAKKKKEKKEKKVIVKNGKNAAIKMMNKLFSSKTDAAPNKLISGARFIDVEPAKYYNFSIVIDMFRFGTSFDYLTHLIVSDCDLDTECIMDLSIAIESNSVCNVIENNEGSRVCGLVSLELLDLSGNELNCENENDIQFWDYFFKHIIYNYMPKLETLELMRNKFDDKICTIVYDYYMKCYNYRDEYITRLKRINLLSQCDDWSNKILSLESKLKLATLIEKEKLPEKEWVQWYYDYNSSSRWKTYDTDASKDTDPVYQIMMRRQFISDNEPKRQMMQDWLYYTCCVGNAYGETTFTRKTVLDYVRDPTKYEESDDDDWSD